MDNMTKDVDDKPKPDTDAGAICAECEVPVRQCDHWISLIAESDYPAEPEPYKASNSSLGWLVTKAELELGKLAAKDDDPRYSINCICIEITAERTQVTNGHLSLQVNGKRADAKEYPAPPAGFVPCNGRTFLHRDTALELAKAIHRPKHWQAPILAHALVGAQCAVTTNLDGWTTRKAETETTYPNVDKVFPVTEPLATVTLNATYVKALAEAFIALGKGNRKITMTFELHGPEIQVEIKGKTDDGREVRAVIMPVRL